MSCPNRYGRVRRMLKLPLSPRCRRSMSLTIHSPDSPLSTPQSGATALASGS